VLLSSALHHTQSQKKSNFSKKIVQTNYIDSKAKKQTLMPTSTWNLQSHLRSTSDQLTILAIQSKTPMWCWILLVWLVSPGWPVYHLFKQLVLLNWSPGLLAEQECSTSVPFNSW
jgi:hypothetical protein